MDKGAFTSTAQQSFESRILLDAGPRSRGVSFGRTPEPLWREVEVRERDRDGSQGTTSIRPGGVAIISGIPVATILGTDMRFTCHVMTFTLNIPYSRIGLPESIIFFM